MEYILTILEFLGGVVLIFVIGRLIAHLLKIDLYFNQKRNDIE